jgi:glycosyltransferase involved in cell wall biosynthesis
MSSPKVSVIIPTYNRKDLLSEAIESVLRQTFTDYEVIVVDHGSTDGTAEWVQATYPNRVGCVPLPYCELPACPRNAGIRAARGEFVAFLDSDDLWLPHTLNRLTQSAQADPAAGLYFGLAEAFEGAKRLHTTIDPARPRSGHVFERLLRSNFVALPTVMVRRDVLQALGGFDERPAYRATEDYDLWLRIAYRHPFHFIPEVLARYRVHGSNMSRGVMARIDLWQMVLENIFKTLVVPLPVQRRTLAILELERFKFTLRTSSPSEALPHLERCLAVDPWNVRARLLHTLMRSGGGGMLRFWLTNHAKELKVNH